MRAEVSAAQSGDEVFLGGSNLDSSWKFNDLGETGLDKNLRLALRPHCAHTLAVWGVSSGRGCGLCPEGK